MELLRHLDLYRYKVNRRCGTESIRVVCSSHAASFDGAFADEKKAA